MASDDRRSLRAQHIAEQAMEHAFLRLLPSETDLILSNWQEDGRSNSESERVSEMFTRGRTCSTLPSNLRIFVDDTDSVAFIVCCRRELDASKPEMHFPFSRSHAWLNLEPAAVSFSTSFAGEMLDRRRCALARGCVDEPLPDCCSSACE